MERERTDKDQEAEVRAKGERGGGADEGGE